MQDESERLTRTRSEAERSMKERDSSESAARNQRVEQRQRTVDSQKAQEKEQWAQVEQQRKTNEQEQFERAGRELVSLYIIVIQSNKLINSYFRTKIEKKRCISSRATDRRLPT